MPTTAIQLQDAYEKLQILGSLQLLVQYRSKLDELDVIKT
jgi:hypothetical protein